MAAFKKRYLFLLISLPVIVVGGAVLNQSCKARGRSSGNDGLKSVDDSNAPYSYEQYTEACKRELGEIPKYSCFEGVEVPIYESGGLVTFENHKGRAQTCDAPTHIRSDLAANTIGANHCVPGTRMGRLKPAPGFEDKVQIVFICRKYFNRNESRFTASDSKVQFSDKVVFDDANVIAHNKETGATCFFVNHINRKGPGITGEWGYDGRQIPQIGSPEGKSFWRSPDEMKVTANFLGVQACTECHDNDPFIHVPYNHNVKFKDGSRVLPDDPMGPYRLVGDWFFHRSEGTVTTQKEWAKLSHLVSAEAQPCTECHRIGSGATCSTFTDLATGATSTQFISENNRNVAWMPQTEDHWRYKEWSGEDKPRLEKAVKFIKNCCANRNAPGCVWEKIPARAL
ncbi:MAG: hypothetical protein NT027_07785 [Proteobacteria bacterium]|nr:hypothetical protein [Pseudomonadota bacterium]